MRGGQRHDVGGRQSKQKTTISPFGRRTDLRVSRPPGTTAYITRNTAISFTILCSAGRTFRSNRKWSIKLYFPDGMKLYVHAARRLRWHDGNCVVGGRVESLKRWGKKDRLGQLSWLIRARYTVDSKHLCLKSSSVWPCARRARKNGGNVLHDASANRVHITEDQLKEGYRLWPFKFARDAWKPGEQVEYCGTAIYVPRDESPSG